ncbi:MAG TPA: cation:proton antiporter subunit C [Thermoanaerobaculia bacterium]|nr:cation:proton antiporter subunit C [Thermoanaerobaculia bacterium]
MPHADYVIAILLLLVGLYGMLARSNLVWKLIAMSFLQVAVIVFFVALAAKSGAGPPITGKEATPLARDYVNPLPHALMLTAIVVGVSTTGLGLALLLRIHRAYDTLEEAELLRRMRE